MVVVVLENFLWGVINMICIKCEKELKAKRFVNIKELKSTLKTDYTHTAGEKGDFWLIGKS